MVRGVVIAGVVLVVAVLAAGCGTRTVTKTVTVSAPEKPEIGPPRELVFYGHIKSLKPAGGSFELRFDPAWLLEGRTAQRAAVDDKVLPPGEPVPNDNYTRDESHRLLSFIVPSTARATVLTSGDTAGIAPTPVPIAELARIVAGKNPKHRPLFGDVAGFGFWMRVHTDTVRSLDEQYHP